MDDIDAQILTVVRSSGPLSCYEAAQQIEDSYGIVYPTKRVRNRMNSLCNHNYLAVEKVPHGKGMPIHIYSLASEGSQ